MVGMLVFLFNIFVELLPSAAWIAQARPVAIVAGLTVAALFIVASFFEFNRRAESGENPGCLLIFGLPFAAWMGFVVGVAPVYLGPPLVRAIVAGTPSGLPFTVASHGVHDGKCPNPVHFVDMPFLIGRVCGLSQAAQAVFEEGDMVIVMGKGSPWGVFPVAIMAAP